MKSFYKHTNIDFLYKVLGMELRDMSSFGLDKKELELKKGKKVFTVINLSYLNNEFHSEFTLDLIHNYISLFSHNLFFFEETQFHMYDSGKNKSNETTSKKKEKQNSGESSNSESEEENEKKNKDKNMGDSDDQASSEGPDRYIETEVEANKKINKKITRKQRYNENILDDILNVEFLEDLNPTISSGFIKLSTSNKLVTLVFEVIKSTNIKKTDLKNKLEKDKYISTIGQNIIKSSHYINILDLANPMSFLKLSTVKIFMDPKKNVNLKNMTEEIKKYYEENNNNEKYSLDFLLQNCQENYDSIY
jgi:hypothetical protein